METRLVIAFSLIGVIAIVGVVALAVYLPRRRRERLRRRGIKSY